MENSDKKYYLTVVLTAFLVIGVVAGIFYWLLQDASKPLTSNQLTAPLKNPKVDNLEKALVDIYQASEISVSPAIVTENEISLSELPEGVLPLINPRGSSVSIKKVEFADKRNGYIIRYQVPSLIYKSQEFYIDLRFTGWTIGDFMHSDAVGLIKLQDDNLDVLVQQSVLDDTNLNVLITVIQT